MQRLPVFGLGRFEVAYERPEEGFSFLTLGDAQLMIDQVGLGRTFELAETPLDRPFGRGLNLQIRVPQVRSILDRLETAGVSLYLPLEEKWYRRDDHEVGTPGLAPVGQQIAHFRITQFVKFYIKERQ